MDKDIQEALEMLEEYRKGGLHGTPAGRLWSAITGALLVALGLVVIFA
ncbi:MAG: hypothetical protein Q8Q41_04595 [bacterium]|nr:hypothetical protein [bacterium]